MAKNLVLNKQNNIKIQTVKAGKPTTIIDGPKTNLVYVSLNSNAEKLVTQITATVEKLKTESDNFEILRKEIGEGVKSEFLKEENLEKLDIKELKAIAQVVSKMEKLNSDFKNEPSQDIKTEIAKGFRVYSDALTDIGKGMIGTVKLREFNTDAFSRNLKVGSYPIPTKEDGSRYFSSNTSQLYVDDLKVVRALEYVGVKLEKIENKGNISWNIKENSSSDILDNGTINDFIKTYLDLPKSARDNHLITPDGIFKLYLELASKKMSKEELNVAKEKFNVKNEDWKAFELSSKDLAVTDGAKMALLDLYSDSLNLEANEEILSSGMQSRIASNSKYVKSSALNPLVKYAQTHVKNVENQLLVYNNSSNLSFKYAKEIERLNDEINNADILTPERENEINAQIAGLQDNLKVCEMTRQFVYDVSKDMSKQSENVSDSWFQTANILSEYNLIKINKQNGVYNISLNADMQKQLGQLLDDNYRNQLENSCKNAMEKINNMQKESPAKADESVKEEAANENVAESEIEQPTTENIDESEIGQSAMDRLIAESQKENPTMENKTSRSRDSEWISQQMDEILGVRKPEPPTNAPENVAEETTSKNQNGNEITYADLDKLFEALNQDKTDQQDKTEVDNELTDETEVEILPDDQAEDAENIAEEVEKAGLSEEDVFGILFEDFTKNDALSAGIMDWAAQGFTDLYMSNSSKENPYKQLIDTYHEARRMEPANQAYATFKSFLKDKYKDNPQQIKTFGSPLFTLDTFSNYEARTRSQEPEYQNGETCQNAKSSATYKAQKANEFISMLVRTRSYLNNEIDLSKDAISPEILKKAHGEAVKDVVHDATNFQLTDEEKQIAQMYKDYIQKSYAKNALEGYMEKDDIRDNSTLSKDMLNVCSKMFTNKDLEQQIANIQNSQNALPKETSQEIVRQIKFSEKYPKDKTAKLLKKFKPFCDKSTAKIIESLMEMIENCYITETKKISNDSPMPKFGGGNNPPQSNKEDQSQGEDKDQSQGEDKEQTANDGNGNNAKNPQANNAQAQDASAQTPQPSTPANNNGSVFKDNELGLPDEEFATYKVLGVSLRKMLEDPAFAKNREEWIKGDPSEKKIQALSTVIENITKASQYEKGTEEHSKELMLKRFLKNDLKSKLFNDNHAYSNDPNSSIRGFYEEKFKIGDSQNLASEELINSICCVMDECKHEDVASTMLISSDLPTVDQNGKLSMPNGKQFQIGNKFTPEEIKAIANCKNEEEVWAIVKKNQQLYQSVWNVPGTMSEKLAEYLKHMDFEQQKAKQAQENQMDNLTQNCQNVAEEFFDRDM